jgi:hypothetical protein
MIEIFFSYAHEDEDLMDEVRRQLIVFERQGRILKWHDRKIRPGGDWKKEIDGRLRKARVILLFMSPRFIESKYCYLVEGQEALRRHDAKEAIVIPIILRPCAWQESPFGKLQALPRDGKPLSTCENQDVTSLEIARGVISVVDNLIDQDKSNQ